MEGAMQEGGEGLEEMEEEVERGREVRSEGGSARRGMDRQEEGRRSYSKPLGFRIVRLSNGLSGAQLP